MEIILKLILFPITLILGVKTLFLQFLLGVGTVILNIGSLFCIPGAMASFFYGEVSLGIEAIVIAFLLSPYGIPMFGAVVVGLLGGVNESIKSI